MNTDDVADEDAQAGLAQRPSVREPGERRNNPALRASVEDMLASIRSAASQEQWTAEERAHHAATMARIMDLVRQQALTQKPKA